MYDIEHITRLITIFFIPLYPAWFVMKRLPKGDASAGGLFSGMKLKLTGGIAFYFVLLLLAKLLYPEPGSIATQHGDAWVVQGVIKLSNTPESKINALNLVSFECKPSWTDNGNGHFMVTVARNEVNGLAVWPRLIFSADQYKPIEIATDDSKLVKIDDQHHLIQIRNPVIMTLLPKPDATPKRIVAQELSDAQ